VVIHALSQALLDFTNLGLWLFLIAGTLIGLIVGIIPGIGSLVALAVFLSFIFKMSPEQALPFMVATSAASITGGSITAILINIPGQETNAATVIDGYPMTRKGEAGRALGAALTSSAMGGVASVFFALAMIPIILPMIMAIQSPDLVSVVLLGIVFIGVLGAGSMTKGLISGGFGLLISFIGSQPSTGVLRFTFGIEYLYDGIGLVPLAMGLFAIPEAISLTVKGGTIAETSAVVGKMRGVWLGARDVFRWWWLWLRSTLIGYFIGLVPGIGAISATFIAYGQAQATSKHPDRFGKGAVEGVIAPESANNASVAGSLLTLLALGIPGGATAALLMGAFLMLGLIPGPEMMTAHLDLSLTLMFVIIIANLLAAGLCFLSSSTLSKIAYVPSRILAPLVLVIALVGVFAYREIFGDVLVALICGILGLAMREFGYNRPALFLGYILGFVFEKYLFISLAASGPLFFLRPISLSFIVISIVVLCFGSIRSSSRSRQGAKKA
jgi:putative tricarboxylic transport membrane protein